MTSIHFLFGTIFFFFLLKCSAIQLYWIRWNFERTFKQFIFYQRRDIKCLHLRLIPISTATSDVRTGTIPEFLLSVCSHLLFQTIGVLLKTPSTGMETAYCWMMWMMCLLCNVHMCMKTHVFCDALAQTSSTLLPMHKKKQLLVLLT